MILAGIIGGIFLAFPGYLYGIIGVLFLQLFLILDCVDGEVARSKQIFSTKGKFLDLIANDIVFVSIFTGLIVKFYPNPIILTTGFCAILFFLLSKLFPFYAKAADEKLTGEYLKPFLFNNGLKLKTFLLVKNITYPPTVILIATAAAVLNILAYLPIFYGIYFVFYYFASLFPRLKNRSEYDKN